MEPTHLRLEITRRAGGFAASIEIGGASIDLVQQLGVTSIDMRGELDDDARDTLQAFAVELRRVFPWVEWTSPRQQA